MYALHRISTHVNWLLPKRCVARSGLFQPIQATNDNGGFKTLEGHPSLAGLLAGGFFALSFGVAFLQSLPSSWPCSLGILESELYPGPSAANTRGITFCMREPVSMASTRGILRSPLVLLPSDARIILCGLHDGKFLQDLQDSPSR